MAEKSVLNKCSFTLAACSPQSSLDRASERKTQSLKIMDGNDSNGSQRPVCSRGVEDFPTSIK